MIDRFDRKTVLIVLCIGFSDATLLCAMAPSYTMLLVARAVAGAFGGVMGAMVWGHHSRISPRCCHWYGDVSLFVSSGDWAADRVISCQFFGLARTILFSDGVRCHNGHCHFLGIAAIAWSS